MDPFRALDLDKINEKKNKRKSTTLSKMLGVLSKNHVQLSWGCNTETESSCPVHLGGGAAALRSSAPITWAKLSGGWTECHWWSNHFFSLVFFSPLIKTVIAPVPLVSHHPLQSDFSLAPRACAGYFRFRRRYLQVD